MTVSSYFSKTHITVLSAMVLSAFICENSNRVGCLHVGEDDDDVEPFRDASEDIPLDEPFRDVEGPVDDVDDELEDEDKEEEVEEVSFERRAEAAINPELALDDAVEDVAEVESLFLLYVFSLSGAAGASLP